MKKYMLFILTAVSALVSSCWEESDHILSYGQSDRQAFETAEKSFENQFDALWTAMNCNYGIWDYEKAHGLDWDDVREQYTPRFRALDSKDTVTDDELKAIYEEILNPLHDGHLVVQVRNLKTGSYLSFSPSLNRINSERKEVFERDMKFSVDMSTYMSMTSGPLQITDGMAPEHGIGRVGASAMLVAQQIIQPLLQQGPPADDAPEHVKMAYRYSKEYWDDFLNVFQYLTAGNIERFYAGTNEMADKYAILGEMMGFSLPKVDAGMVSKDPGIQYYLFGGNIPYLRISDFMLTAWMDDKVFAELSSGDYPTSEVYRQEIKATWQAWLDAISRLKAAGQLKGVIIDVRSNGGGFMDDFKYILGSLLPSGGYSFFQVRTKQGIGRYDYAPPMDARFPTLSEPHVVVDTEPVVVLCNTRSVSMAEMTSAAAKSLPNGCLIGNRTWGALSSLTTDESSYSQLYASVVGKQNETPFFAYIPRMIAVFPGLGIQEGVGIIPDIELDLDLDLLANEKRDNQLERAIEYIMK